MEKQVSANEGYTLLLCTECEVHAPVWVWQVRKNRRRITEKEEILPSMSIYRINGFHNRTWRFISTAKYYRNNINCFPEQIMSSFVKLRITSACRQVMSRGERTYTEEDYWLALRWAEVRGLYYLFVLTRWHIYSSGVHAKLIWHGARDSQVGSGHDFDPVGYSSVGKGTVIQLNEKRNGISRACMSDFFCRIKSNLFPGMRKVRFAPLGGDVGSVYDWGSGTRCASPG